MRKLPLTSNNANKVAVVAAGTIPLLVEPLVCGSYGPLIRSSTSGGIAPVATTAAFSAALSLARYAGNMCKSLPTGNDVNKAAVAVPGTIPLLVELLICGSYGPLIRSSTSGGIAPAAVTAASSTALLLTRYKCGGWRE